ncbi:hypothetical protein Lalb_Chr25g0289631 [Lupinus albus]|uniref:Uncharacterized protein n=1 Tax=Lupinus albus TaxID=3870 RepID=A0A6A4N5D3_LUPAL|nr:hypothetical protein Lalb_Chr25g0289631 [Lupinus albus]
MGASATWHHHLHLILPSHFSNTRQSLFGGPSSMFGTCCHWPILQVLKAKQRMEFNLCGFIQGVKGHGPFLYADGNSGRVTFTSSSIGQLTE